MSAATVPSSQDPLEALEESVDVVTGQDVDGLTVPEVRDELEGLERARRRIEARQCRLADSMRRRRARVLAEAGGDPDKAERQARRQTERELRERLSWSPSDAKRATRLGESLPPDGDGGAGAGAAFDEGRLPPRHAQVLAETLDHLEEAQRADAEARLLARAREEDAVTFGRSCRRLLAELDHDAAASAEDRRRTRRSGRIAQTADGMLAVSAQLSGLDAEIYASAVHAFRRPDATDEHRSPQQATADAMAQMARAALKLGEAPTQHGVRPHAVVTLDWQSILADAGVAEGAWTGPLPFGEVRRLLADCGVSRLLLDARGVPVEAGHEVRDVPVGLYRGLQLRDGGCIGLGCDAPAAWCEVMHLDVPYRLQGRLTLQTAALGCNEHHVLLDRHGWEVTWVEGRPVLHAPGRDVGARTAAGRAGSGASPPPSSSPPPSPSPSPPSPAAGTAPSSGRETESSEPPGAPEAIPLFDPPEGRWADGQQPRQPTAPQHPGDPPVP